MSEPQACIDTDKLAVSLRNRTIRGRDQFLLTKFTGSLQETDFSERPNCEGFGRIHHFRLKGSDRWIPNPLPQEVAAWRLGAIPEGETRVQVFQSSACEWRCWYCYVDFALLSAIQSRGSYLTADQILDIFLAEKNGIRVIDLSGGQPDIIPEWPVRMLESLARRHLEKEYFVWLDDNLSVYYAWHFLTQEELSMISRYRNFARVGCFKGFSPDSFSENTHARPELLQRQIDIMSRWVRQRVDSYGYITLTTRETAGMNQHLTRFIDEIQSRIGHFFPLRIVPLEIFPFTPMISRMGEAENRALQNQYEVLNAWKDEIQSRFSKSERALRIFEVPMSESLIERRHF